MGPRNSLVTVGTPVFNGESYLARALDSILAQDYPHIELVISDNASTDGTEEICRSYASQDERIRYFRHEFNHGGAWNHRFVVAEAKGTFFRYHAHDDDCLPSLISRCAAILEARSDVVMCYSGTLMIDEKDRVFAVYDDDLRAMSDRPHERLRSLVNRLFYCNVNYGLVRTDIMRATRGHGAYVRADHVQLAELALRGKLYSIPEPLFKRRFHAKMSTSGPTVQDRATWFDPGNAESRLYFPVARLYYEHLRAIYLSQLGLLDRLRCYAVYNSYSIAWTLRTLVARLRGRSLLHVPLDRIELTSEARDADLRRLELW